MRYISPDVTANTKKLCLYRSLVNNEMTMLQKGTTATSFVLKSRHLLEQTGQQHEKGLKTVGLHSEAIHEDPL